MGDTILDWDLTGDISKMIPLRCVDLLRKKKRLASKSPEGHSNRNKRRNISKLQVSEFVWAFLEGTQTVPSYSENNLLEVDSDDEEATLEESTNAVEGESLQTATKIPDAVSSHREESWDDSINEDLK